MLEVQQIPPLDRIEFYGSRGWLRVMEPDTEILMRERNEAEWRDDQHSAHGQPWFTSLHASEFTGDNFDGCDRYFVYRMMDIPAGEAMPPWVTSTGEVGKAGELDIVKAWYLGRRCLAVPEGMPGGERQIGFEDPEIWMSGSIDLAILKPFWTKPHIVEIKGKADEVLTAMHAGERKWDDQHRRQLLASLSLANRNDWGNVTVCRETWRIMSADILQHDPRKLEVCPEHGTECLHTFHLDPPDTGSIYYWSRSWPRGKPGQSIGQPIEYLFSIDQQFIDAGRAVFARARKAFLEGRIPERNEHFMWSLGACRHCHFKRECCRPDEGKKNEPTVTRIAESHAIEFAKDLNPDYDLASKRAQLFERWNEEDPLAGERWDGPSESRRR